MKSNIKTVRTWDQLNPVIYDGDEAISTRVLEKKYRDAVDVAEALLDYIDSIPKEIEISGATGVNRDWIERVLGNKA